MLSSLGHDGMTARERAELAALVRRREKVAKSGTRQRVAELVADVEAQLAASYASDDARWRDLTAAAEAAVSDADAAIATRCRELGIPEDFRPGLRLSWYGRGENASAQRRSELRRVAGTRIAAMEQAARAEIERRSVEVQTALLAGGLASAAARTFLESMPTPDHLMPALALSELEAVVPIGAGRSRLDDLVGGGG